jgi:branched-subunit amino acid ABC-type transport system permease component
VLACVGKRFQVSRGSDSLPAVSSGVSSPAAISQLSGDVVASNTARFLIFSGVIVVFATTVIIATKGRLGRAKEAVATQTEVSDLNT